MVAAELACIVAFCATYQFFFRVVSHELCSRYLVGYASFTAPQKKKIHAGNASLCHTITVAVIGFQIFKGGQSGIVWNGYDIRSLFLCNSIAYFLSDLYIMVSLPEITTMPSVMLHHLVCLLATVITFGCPEIIYYYVFRSLSEVVQPFFHFRFCIRCLRMEDGKIERISGVLLSIAFFLSRVVVIPIFWMQYSADKDVAVLSSKIKGESILLVLVCIVLDVMNLYWFSIIISTWKNFASTLKLKSHNQALLR